MTAEVIPESAAFEAALDAGKETLIYSPHSTWHVHACGHRISTRIVRQLDDITLERRLMDSGRESGSTTRGNEQQLLATAKALSSSVYTSKTFRSLQAWDDEAEKTVAELESLLPDLIARRDMAHALYAEKRAEWKSKGYFRTLFRSSNPPVEEARALHSIEDTADAMQAQTRTLLELMDMTPNNDQERNAFIKSVRLGIEELQLQERELATSVRRSNQAACQMTLDATTSLWNLTKTGRMMKRMEKVGVRSAKQQSSVPLHDERTRLERQIIEFERVVAWAQSLQ